MVHSPINVVYYGYLDIHMYIGQEWLAYIGVGVVAEWLGRLLISSDYSLINPLIRGRPGSIPALTLELTLEKEKKSHANIEYPRKTSDRIPAYSRTNV